MKKLSIAAGLSLPLEAVTQTLAVLAKRGSGKSYAASVIAEEMLDAGQQIVTLDPTGGWYGLRSSADGKSPGYPVVVFGGEHADVPLEESAGEVIAQAIVDHGFSAIIDLSLFRKGQTIRFAVAFLEALYRLNRKPVHLFVDEADAFAPQASRYGGDEMRLLGAMEDVVRRGRKRGIGCTLITQRPAVLNKSVLTQCESLLVLRMVHPRDIDAIKEWVNVHAEPAQAKEVIDSLPSLPVGTAWFWSPGWLGILQRIKVRQRTTFDSSATPKPGETVRQPKARAEINLQKLGAEIQATVDRAKADDPRELRKRIAELERAAKPAAAPAPKVERVEVPVVSEEMAKRLDAAVKAVDAAIHQADQILAAVRDAMDRARTPEPAKKPAAASVASRPAPPRAKSPEPILAMVAGISRPQQRILDALAFLESVSIPAPRRGQVALVAEVSSKSSGFEKNLSTLSTAGLICYPGPGLLALTAHGRVVAHRPATPPTTEELQASLIGRVSRPQGTLLRKLIDAYPEPLSREELARRADVSAASSGFEKNMSTLRSLGLVDYPTRGAIAASSVLFLDGA